MKKLLFVAGLALIVAGCNDSEEYKYNDPGTNGGQSGQTTPGQTTPGQTTINASKLFTTRSSALMKANSCDDYRSHLLDSTAADIARDYFSYRWRYDVDYAEEAVPAADNANQESGNAGSSDSGKSSSAADYTVTNVQEEGVDEIDSIKNDGKNMYILNDGKVRILQAWPAEEMKELGTIDIEFRKNDQLDEGRLYEYGYAYGLLLSGQKLIVLSHETYDFNPYTSSTKEYEYYQYTAVYVYDVANPASPKLIKKHRIEGDISDARLIKNKLYVVIHDWSSQYNVYNQLYRSENWEDDMGLPKIDDEKIWNMNDEERQALIAQYTPVVRQFLENKFPNNDALKFPQYDDGTARRNAVSCSDIYIPATASTKVGMMMVAEFSGDNFENYHAQAVTDGGWTMYASSSNIFLAANSRDWYWYWGCWDDKCENYTQIHRFSIENGVQYIASGEIKGQVYDPYRMSEYDGYLRVASDNLVGWGNEEGTSLSVLDIKNMKVVGEINGIAKGESIYASRMFGKKGYIVTYLQTDPLFTIDLSNPTKPEIKGELKINGYSSYIHPLGDNALLTIGRDGDEEGNVKGVQLQIFDVSDMANPVQKHKELITPSDTSNTWSSSDALWDTHAFTYHAASGLLAVPVSIEHWSWYDNYTHFSGIVIYKATLEGGFERIGRISHSDLDANNNWYVNLDRSRFMFKNAGVYDKDAYVYTISNLGVKASNALKPSETYTTVKFPAPSWSYDYPYYEDEPIPESNPNEDDEIDPGVPEDDPAPCSGDECKDPVPAPPQS